MVALARRSSSEFLPGTFLPVPVAARLEFTSVTPLPDKSEKEVEVVITPSDRTALKITKSAK